MVTIELTEGEVNLLLQLIDKSPMQGNLQTLSGVIAQLLQLREKLHVTLHATLQKGTEAKD